MARPTLYLDIAQYRLYTYVGIRPQILFQRPQDIVDFPYTRDFPSVVPIFGHHTDIVTL